MISSYKVRDQRRKTNKNKRKSKDLKPACKIKYGVKENSKRKRVEKQTKGDTAKEN